MLKSIPDEMINLVANCKIEGINFNTVIDTFNDSMMVLLLDEEGNRIGDAICHDHSYGHELGLLEIMGKGCPEGDVLGWLTAEEVMQKWR